MSKAHKDSVELVSIEKIKNPFTASSIKRSLTPVKLEDSDDDVQFVKAERVYPTAPSKMKLQPPPPSPKPAPVIPSVDRDANEDDDDDDEEDIDPLNMRKSFPCKECKKILVSAADLVKHMELRHTKKPRRKPPKPKEDQADGPFICSVCGYTFARKNALSAHMNAHRDDKERLEIECKDCGEKFLSRGILHRHKKQAHMDVVHTCEICKATFVTPQAYRSHLNRHATKKNEPVEAVIIMCDICGKSKIVQFTPSISDSFLFFLAFNLYKSLETHMYIHKGVTPFKCDVCGSGFRSKQCLTLHKKIHTGERNYECTICSKRFICKSKLNKHTYVHTKQKVR